MTKVLSIRGRTLDEIRLEEVRMVSRVRIKLIELGWAILAGMGLGAGLAFGFWLVDRLW
jgi:hypothetical protein